ncbi:hypothetical protein [Flavobacterium terrigena]|uniref:Uncharacterized protein n=1 Tax=Flavobacterium terrigena TaxID=402734 RepID=A0A1H6VWH7_9FLAO|nr:hypothetical protein [Flavobacterium terrigena]SEJ08973.1 hypothetical protein SAMN05660918_2334 [Flavobacterium terrigena]
MKKIFIVFTFLIFSKSFAIVGLADWQFVTSKGNVFNDYQQDGISLSINKEDIKIDNLTRWYFYNDFIIGEHLNESSQLEYFFVNEINSKVIFFDTFDESEKFKNENDLKPLFWTRWNDENSIDSIFVFLINFFAFIIVFIYVIVFLIRLFKKPRNMIYKNEAKFCLIFVIALLIINLLDNFKISF